MSRVPNTVRKQGIYHFRRAVPAELRKRLCRGEMLCSLRTTHEKLARVRSRWLYLRAEELFEAARSHAMLTTEDLARMVQDFYHSALEDENEIRLNSRVIFDEANRQAIIAHYAGMGERTRRDLATNNLSAAAPFAADLIAKFGLTDQLDDNDVARVQQAILRVGCDYTDAMKARFEDGGFSFQPRDPLLNMAVATSSATIIAPTIAPVSTNSIAPEVEGELFSVRAKAFRLQQVRLKLWRNQSGLQARKTYELFVEICGDRPLAGYVKSDAAAFKETLQHLPANYGKAPRYRGLSAGAIVEMTRDDPSVELLTGRTVQRHMAAMSTLWQNAVERGELANNLFVGFKFGATKRARDQRQMWETHQLHALFNTPVWRGCKSDARRAEPGDLVLRDEKFWLPLLAVFAGTREEEICQLKLVDIKEEGGISYLDINSRSGEKLKNVNAVRLVPVHDELIRLGFLRYVADQRAAGRQMLFHQLSPGGADSRFGHNFSKWFTRYRRNVGLYQKRLDFHSMRHSTTTFLTRAGVQELVIDRLTAHESKGETARYTKDLPLTQLAEAMNKVDIGVDLSFLYV